MPCASEDKRRRLFFALWPNAAVRRRLARTNRQLSGCGGKPVAVDNLHLTLRFLGPVDESRYQCVVAAAGAARGAPFELVFDTAGHFHRARIAWLGTSQPVPDLNGLYMALERACQGCGFPPEARPFVPHLTLRRGALRAPLAPLAAPIHWTVEDFVLVESHTFSDGVQYRVLHRWLLAA